MHALHSAKGDKPMVSLHFPAAHGWHCGGMLNSSCSPPLYSRSILPRGQDSLMERKKSQIKTWKNRLTLGWLRRMAEKLTIDHQQIHLLYTGIWNLTTIHHTIHGHCKTFLVCSVLKNIEGNLPCFQSISNRHHRRMG